MTTMRWPNRGRRSYQLNLSRRATTSPICAYPDLQPYDGQFAYEGVIPHLTVAYHEDESVLEHIYRELADCRVDVVASSVDLMELREERWHRVCEFRLAG